MWDPGAEPGVWDEGAAGRRGEGCAEPGNNELLTLPAVKGQDWGHVACGAGTAAGGDGITRALPAMTTERHCGGATELHVHYRR